jgi:hypothetical protein
MPEFGGELAEGTAVVDHPFATQAGGAFVAASLPPSVVKSAPYSR